MAKMKKISGIKFYMDDEEATALSFLLRRGVEDGTLKALGLTRFSNELYNCAYYKSGEFVRTASIDGKED